MKYVITGGPCTGKTTTVDEISRLGYLVVPEAARMLIAEEQRKPNGILPWTNLAEFQRLVLRRQLDLESRLDGEQVFYDRGLLDNLAYCRLNGIDAPIEFSMVDLHHRYSKVFLLNPVGDYKADAERKEDPIYAKRLHDLLKSIYQEFGYDVIRIPLLKPKERAELIISRATQAGHLDRDSK